MAQPAFLTRAEKERIWQEKQEGFTLAEIADHLGCRPSTVRKWWLMARDHGPSTLTTPPRRGRPCRGPCSTYPPSVVATAQALISAHPRWGPARLRLALADDPAVGGGRLPSLSRLSALHAAQRPPPPLPAPPPAPPPAPQASHEVWQLDMQEGLRFGLGQRATTCTIRDPFSGAIIASRAFETTRGSHWRKLTEAEIQQVLRGAFAEWGTLPQQVQTDNEVVLAGTPSDPFPTRLTLWLAALGVAHRFIHPHCPREQAQVERTHRTLYGWLYPTEQYPDLAALQQALDREREVYNRRYPVRASGCAGMPPLAAYPSLGWARRPYSLAREAAQVEWERVEQLLAALKLERRVSETGRVSVGRQLYSLGRGYGKQPVRVEYNRATREWVFTLTNGTELRRAIKGLTLAWLLGPLPLASRDEEPGQLTPSGLAA